MANVLGLNFGHDGAAAIVKEGRLVAAISNERISRAKKARGVSYEMIDYVLEVAGLRLEDIQCVAFSSYFSKPDNLIKIYETSGTEVKTNLLSVFGGLSCQEYLTKLKGRAVRALLVQHHIAHCASAFYTSPFEKAACFSLDASGVHPELCSLFAYGDREELHYLACPGLMIGNVYSVFTAKLGLGDPLVKAGSTMALASFGKPTRTVDRWRDYGESWYSRTFQPSDAVYYNYIWPDFSGLAPQEVFSREQSDSEAAMNTAATLQAVFEKVLVDYSAELYRLTERYNGGNLVLSGGSFLNSDANMRIREETPFGKNIHLFPACGDDGTAPGAALYVAHHLLRAPRVHYEPREYMYLGRTYSSPYAGRRYEPAEVAQLLAQGKVVALFQGRSEYGPRALGNRSILADPRSPTMKDHLNREVKHREWFRPFAPVVLEEKKNEWFAIDFESKLMLFIARIRRPAEIPAVAHVDQTARVQTVAQDDNPRLYRLIEEFEKITGVPILLNTSLNDNAEPLVETPQDAMALFERTAIDALVIEDQLFLKQG